MDQTFDEDQDVARLRFQRHRAGLARSHLGGSKVLALVASAKRRKQIGAMSPMGAGYDAEASAILAQGIEVGHGLHLPQVLIMPIASEPWYIAYPQVAPPVPSSQKSGPSRDWGIWWMRSSSMKSPIDGWRSNQGCTNWLASARSSAAPCNCRMILEVAA